VTGTLEVVEVWAQIAATILTIFRILASRKGTARLCDMFADVVVQFDDGETISQKGVTQIGFNEVQKTVTLVTGKVTIQANLKHITSMSMSNISGVRAVANPREGCSNG